MKIKVGIVSIIMIISGCAAPTELIAPMESLSPEENALLGTSVPAEEIENLADETIRFIKVKISDASDRSEKLKDDGVRRKIILRIGQFAGGAGAVLFGLNDKGKNAAYAGAVSAIFTGVDEIWDSPEDERAACSAIVDAQFELLSTPNVWKLKRNDPEFQASFIQEYIEFNSQMGQLFSRCDIKYQLDFRNTRREQLQAL